MTSGKDSSGEDDSEDIWTEMDADMASTFDVGCYVLVERSARLELDGYDFVVWHVVLEACASDTR